MSAHDAIISQMNIRTQILIRSPMKNYIAFLLLSLATLACHADPGFFVSNGWWIRTPEAGTNTTDRTFEWAYSEGAPSCDIANCKIAGGLYNAGYRYFGPVITTEPSRGSAVSSRSPSYVEIRSTDTYAMVVERFKSTYGTSGSVWMPRSLSVWSNEFRPWDCMAVYQQANSGTTPSDAVSGTCVSTRERTSTPETCNITGPTAINHGLMEVSEVNGKTAQINATVTCPVTTYVQFKIISQNINLGNGITSQIKVNNSTYPPTQQVKAGVATSVQISSTLVATNPQPGQFSGSSVIVVNVY